MKPNNFFMLRCAATLYKLLSIYIPQRFRDFPMFAFAKFFVKNCQHSAITKTQNDELNKLEESSGERERSAAAKKLDSCFYNFKTITNSSNGPKIALAVFDMQLLVHVSRH